MSERPAVDGEQRRDLALRIEALLREVDGVCGVYRSGSLISNLLRAGTAALGGTRGGEPIVSVASGADGIAVEASIGVDVGAASGAILREARGAVDALLAAEGLSRESISLIVAYVQSEGVAASAR